MVGGDAFWETKDSAPLTILDDTKCSVKVFLGGVPWDLTETKLMKYFTDYGNFYIFFSTQEVYIWPAI